MTSHCDKFSDMWGTGSARQALIRFLNPELNEPCKYPDDYVSVLSCFFDACDANGVLLDSEDEHFAANPPEGFPTLVAHHPAPQGRGNEVRPFKNGWISVI